jgi:hypothetical protein
VSYLNFRKAQMRPREHRNARHDIGFIVRCWRNWLGEKHTHIHRLAYLSANTIWDVSCAPRRPNFIRSIKKLERKKDVHKDTTKWRHNYNCIFESLTMCHFHHKEQQYIISWKWNNIGELIYNFIIQS